MKNSRSILTIGCLNIFILILSSCSSISPMPIATATSAATSTKTPTITPVPATRTPLPTETLPPISLTFTATRPPGAFSGSPFPNAKIYFFLTEGFDLNAVRTQLTVHLSGPNGAVPDDFQVWQWSQGADNAIALFIFPVLPAGTYTIRIVLPDGRSTSTAFEHKL